MQRHQPMPGAVLRAARVLAGMTQADLSTAAGLHAQSVAYWEREGSRGVFGEVGTRRIVEALRERGIVVTGGVGEGVSRVSQSQQSNA